jgi:hypothetical protein
MAVALHTLEVRGQDLLDVELPGLAQVDELPQVVDEGFSSGRMQLLAQEQPPDSERPFSVCDRGTDVAERDRVRRAQRTRDVSLHEVVEREPGSLRVCGADDPLKGADAVLPGIGSPGHPRTKSRGGTSRKRAASATL